MDSEQLAHFLANLTLEKKAEQVIIMDLCDITTITDYFVICNGDSETQIKAISDYVLSTLKDKKIKVWHTEGYKALDWVLLDLVDVVVHIFKPDVREFYALERLWGDAKIIEVKDEN